MHHVRVDHDEIAYCEIAVLDPECGHDHCGDQACIYDEALAEIQKGERGLRLDRGPFIGLHRLVIAGRFTGFSAKILYRFKV